MSKVKVSQEGQDVCDCHAGCRFVYSQIRGESRLVFADYSRPPLD